jgi:hypothetical protein
VRAEPPTPKKSGRAKLLTLIPELQDLIETGKMPAIAGHNKDSSINLPIIGRLRKKKMQIELNV